MGQFVKVRAWWARYWARRQDDAVERARQQMNEALEKAENWRVIAEIRKDEYERLSGAKVLPRKAS